MALKTYLAHTLFLPKAAAALGEPDHVMQVCVFAVAPTKTIAAALMEDRSQGARTAAAFAKTAKLNNGFNTLKALRAAGLAPDTRSAVYVTSASHPGGPVLRIEEDGGFTRIATIDARTNTATPA